MTTTTRPRSVSPRAAPRDATLPIAACCGVKLLIVLVVVAVAAGPWVLGALLAILGGLALAWSRRQRTRHATEAVSRPGTAPAIPRTAAGAPVGARDELSARLARR